MGQGCNIVGVIKQWAWHPVGGAIRISPEELQGAMPTALSGHEGTLTNQEVPSTGSDSLDTDVAQNHFPK
jgi:hypothetical protein